jgi:gas vesicle protein
MKKLLIGALLGGAIGAGVAKLQGGTGEQDSSSMAPAVAGGAAVGAFFGLLLARRGRKAAKAAAAVPVALAYARKVGDAALEVIEQATEAAMPVIEDIHERIAA